MEEESIFDKTSDNMTLKEDMISVAVLSAITVVTPIATLFALAGVIVGYDKLKTALNKRHQK